MTTALSNGLRRVAARLAPDSAPDGELLSRFLASRDEAAFALLVRRHGGMVFGTCRRVLGNAADADDAFQAAFVVLMRKAHSLTGRACVGNFLYGVAFHTALKARAMATKRRAKEAKATRPEPAGDGELTRVLDEELANLPDKYREPVVLCELEGVPRREAADRLGIAEGTISSRLATAHRMLAKRLAARGFAAVAVAAVLADQAAAVSETLTEAAVRAAVGGPPPAVTQLACEVSKMLLWNKLRAGAVLAGVVVLLGLGLGLGAKALADDKPAAKAPAPVKEAKKPDDAKLLQGKWVTKAVTFDPPFRVEPGAIHTPAHHELTFADKDLTWVTFIPNDPKTSHTQTKPFKLDQTTSPKELTSGVNDCVYELDGDTLKLAMYFLTPGRPKGFNAKDSPPGRGHVIVIELTRVKEEADKSYSLKDGELLKLIPAPFPEDREAVFKQVNQRRELAGEPKDYRMVIPAEGEYLHQCYAASGSENGWQLRQALAVTLKIDEMDCVADAKLLSAPFDADVLVRPDTPADKLLPALQAELKAKCGIDVTLELREMEREVVVASGTYQKRAGPNQIEPRHEYALDTDEPKGKPNWGTNVFNRGFLPAIGNYVRRPVVDETNITTLRDIISFSLHEYHHQKPDDPKFKAPDPETVLKRLAEQTGLTFKLEKRKLKALVVAKADDPKAKPAEKKDEAKNEPAWKGEFREAYGLKEGQLVRRVAPPYPDCREAYFKDLWKGGAGNIPFDQQFAVFAWKDDWTAPQPVQSTMPVKPDAGIPLERLLDMTLKISGTRIEADQTTRGTKVTGDFVVRGGADPEKAAADLEAILRKECELPVEFSFRDAEEEVYVLAGKYQAKPLEGKKTDEVEVYAVYRNDGKTGGGGSGTLAELAAAVERYVGKTVVLGEVQGEPKRVSWHFNDRDKPFTLDDYAQDHDPQTVLENIAAQTGLKVTTEKRKVRILVVDLQPLKK